MTDNMVSTLTDADLEKQIDLVRDVAARSIDPCFTAKFIALSDQRVRALLLKKIQHGDVFLGIDCLNPLSVPENKYVYFDFECKPGTLCFIRPAFAVVVNIVHGYVVAILDPYISTSADLTDTVRGRGDVTLDINISLRHEGDSVCAKVKVKVKVEGIGSGTVSLPEVCLSSEGVCSSVDSGGGDVRAKAEICWNGPQICAEVTGKIKILGRWYEHTDKKCKDI